jgi:putative tricarboxylic transport membrane protein
MSTAQVAYWDGVLSRLVKTDEWKQELARNQWDELYKGQAEVRRFLAAEQAEIKAVLSEIGLAK